MVAPRSLSAHRTAQLAAHAAEMRWAPTPSEAALSEALRGSKLGVLFRRQVVIGRYIADFAAAQVGLVVEVDGAWHAGREEADARRDRALGRAGYRVLRVAAQSVLGELPAVVARIGAALAGAAAPR